MATEGGARRPSPAGMLSAFRASSSSATNVSTCRPMAVPSSCSSLASPSQYGTAIGWSVAGSTNCGRAASCPLETGARDDSPCDRRGPRPRGPPRVRKPAKWCAGSVGPPASATGQQCPQLLQRLAEVDVVDSLVEGPLQVGRVGGHVERRRARGPGARVEAWRWCQAGMVAVAVVLVVTVCGAGGEAAAGQGQGGGGAPGIDEVGRVVGVRGRLGRYGEIWGGGVRGRLFSEHARRSNGARGGGGRSGACGRLHEGAPAQPARCSGWCRCWTSQPRRSSRSRRGACSGGVG